MRSTFLLLAAIGVQACQRERVFNRHSHQHTKRQTDNAPFPPVLDANEQILVDSFDSVSLSNWLYYYTHGAHLAGQNQTMAQWTADRWAEYGFTSRLDEYYVYLNYPLSHSIVVTYPNGSTYTPSLKEAALSADETTTWPNSIPTFHGYSFSGNACAEYIYVGRGQQADFDRLVALGVDLTGKIALSKYGGPFRGLKVKNAQDYGMIGAVIFTDPGDDGNMTEAMGLAPYPDGPARNPTSVQRGSVQFLSTYPGDPTSPGYPSKPGVSRVDPRNTTPQIPSLPISWIEAQPILQALNGFGPNASDVNRRGWKGAIPGVEYSTGSGSGAALDLNNVMQDTYTTIWDAVGIINGTNEDEVVIVGNHRDAWILGGADPNSGSSILIELAKAFGKLTKTGWKPTRTIVLCSWDAEEYGLVGSTEWMEEFVPWLKSAAVSYLNIDIAVAGPIPDIGATPDMYTIGENVMKKIVWPYRNRTDLTMYDVWKSEDPDAKPDILGSGSDYTSFLHRGLSAIDMGAGGGPTDPIYHYHSSFDSYHWMTTLGDPGFVTHKAMGQYLTLLLYHMASDAVLPLEPANYAPELRGYLDDLKTVVSASNYTIDLSALGAAIDTFSSSANAFDQKRAQAVQANDTDLLTEQNHKARDFSRGFTSQGGLPTRPFYQNTIFAPGRDTGYAPVTFPGITESITFDKNASLAQEWVRKTANAILEAASILTG